MKKRNLYQILLICMMGICVVGMCLVGIRIFAKKILVERFGLESYLVCMLADYNWGDRLQGTLPEKTEAEEKPQRLTELEEILAKAPKEEQPVHESLENTAKGTLAGAMQTMRSLKDKVTAAEDDITKYCNDKFLLYRPMRTISSSFDAMVGWNLAYARAEGATYTLNTGYDYQAVEKKDVAAFTQRLIRQSRIAQDAGINFLYVQYPYRVDEENSQVPWGASSEENANADAVQARLSEAGVDSLDLRKNLPDKGWSNNDRFYLTDGHWDTRSGFVSAGIVADYLNMRYGFSYDTRYFDEENYDVQSYSLNSYAVEEEVELFLPDFETDLCVMDAYRQEAFEGNFAQACFDMTKADTEEYSSVLTAYSASRIRNSYLFEYQNRMEVNNQKRILISSDSFSWHLIPYLALDTNVVDYVYKMTPEQMEYYVEVLQPDLVIVLDRP
ncbi:MAG: hypothetical protein PUB98_00045 [Clostridiales bacterium]|nr:hypothetical protein [Clostridiales bacterium]